MVFLNNGTRKGLPEKNTVSYCREKSVALGVYRQKIGQIGVTLQGKTDDFGETFLLFVGEGVVTNTSLFLDFISVPVEKT